MRAQRFYVVRGEAPDNFRGVASGCPLFRGKNVRESAVGNAKTVRCSEFRGGRFSEVANVLHKRDFQSVIATLSAVGSVSASRSVRSERFYCISTTFDALSSVFVSCFAKKNIIALTELTEKVPYIRRC